MIARACIGLVLMFLSMTNWAKNPETLSPTPSTSAYNASTYLAISIDNDLFAPRNSDKDYTAGVALTLQNLAHNKVTGMLDTPLTYIDRALFEVDEKPVFGFEFGSYGFTPDDIESALIDRSDRPYASLVYASALRRYPSTDKQGFWTSAFTIGVLGADLFKRGQDIVHDVVTGDEARGWHNQISDGGEMTMRYQLAYHQPLFAESPDLQFKLSYFGSLGYLTEAGLALGYRQGLISSPDYRFNPAITSYGEQSNASDTGPGGRESYFWAGVGFKARAYNAFLEGQFRHSEHTIKRSRLRPLIVEFWSGYTLSLFSNAKLSYVVRAQSSEIRDGRGDRNVIWGGFVLSFAIN